MHRLSAGEATGMTGGPNRRNSAVASAHCQRLFAGISLVQTKREHAMANKEQKRSSREAKKPKQKKKGADKSAGKPQAAKS